MDTPWAFHLAVACSGVATHQLIFRWGEWHLKGLLILQIYALIYLFILVCEVTRKGHYHGFGASICLLGIHFISFFASLIIYRVIFHRLVVFPGPFFAKVSKFWHVGRCIQSYSQNHLVLDKLHEKYGEFVRTGPSEVTVFHPDVFRVIDGPGNRCTKSNWYDFLLPEIALNTTRDKGAHDQRRRVWDRGFSTKALAQYEERIAQFALLLNQSIKKRSICGEPIDIGQWIYWYSFDVMGHFAFARSFDMLQDEKWHYVILLLRRAMSLLGPLSPVPWLAQLGFALIPNTWIVRDWNDMMNWCKSRMLERISMKPTSPDVSSYLLEGSAALGRVDQDVSWLNGDSIAMVIAGSDTVAPTLIFLLYELARNPLIQDTLRQELSGVDIDDHQSLQELPYLTGVVNETLRLHPPVPTGGYRDTPPDGVIIGDTFIPGHTTIVAPRYTIGRLESCFLHATSFLPERWSAHELPKMVFNKQAFMPFSQGRYSCVGKNLALKEIRYVAAMFVASYKITFASGEEGNAVERDMKDQFTAAPGRLMLQFQLVQEHINNE